MTQPFSYAYYRGMLSAAQRDGYVLSSFREYNSGKKKTIIVRHDVDYTLNGVLDIAQIERDLDVTATYMFRVHAHEYNLFSPHAYRLLQDLQALGHEIGLHFEAPNFARVFGLCARDVLRKEKQILESLAGCSIVSGSEHRDISNSIHATPYYSELFNIHDDGFQFYAMNSKFCKEMKYLSDSNGFWREGDLLVHLGDHDKFQIVTHPDWWFEDDLLLKGPYFHGLGN